MKVENKNGDINEDIVAINYDKPIENLFNSGFSKGAIDYSDPINNYYDELQQVLNKYTELYPYSKNKHNDFGVKETWNIQKYNPNEGYFIKHFEI